MSLPPLLLPLSDEPSLPLPLPLLLLPLPLSDSLPLPMYSLSSSASLLEAAPSSSTARTPPAQDDRRFSMAATPASGCEAGGEGGGKGGAVRVQVVSVWRRWQQKQHRQKHWQCKQRQQQQQRYLLVVP